MTRHSAARRSRTQTLRNQFILFAAGTVAIGYQSPGLGQSYTWTSAANGTWGATFAGPTSNWTSGTAGTFPNAAGAVAVFSQDWTGQTITVDGTYTLGVIDANDTVLGGGGLILSGGTLTLNNGANKPVINTTNNLTEPGGTAPFNNPLRITSILAGTNGFEKTGPGYLSLEAANVFTGNIKLTAPAAGGGSFLRLTNDNNLGDSGNDIEVAANAQAVGFYVSTGFTVTLNSGRNISTSSATGAQDFWVKTKGTGNLIIDGVISGATRLRKNDSGFATLRGANTFTGGVFIEGGTLTLSGGDQRLPSGSAVTMGSAPAAVTTFDVTNTTQTVNALTLGNGNQVNNIRGSGGTLNLQGSGDYTVSATSSVTSLDMSALSNFTFTRASNAFQISANGAGVTNTVNLAKAGGNTLSAANVRFGGGGANAAGQLSNIGLGQTNAVNAGTEFLVGFFQGSASVGFQSGLTNPSLTIRGAGGGASPTPLFRIGQTNSGNQPTTGTLNLSGGSIDVIATQMDVGAHNAGANTAATGRLIMPAGTVVANTLSVARKTNTTGTPTITGVIQQSGGTVTASTVYLGNNEGITAATFAADYTITGGTLYAATIDASGAVFNAGSSRNLNVNGGTVRNYDASTDLTIDGVDSSAGGRVNVVFGVSGGKFFADPGRTITVTSFAPISGAGGLSKQGGGTLTLRGANSYAGGYSSIDEGTLAGESDTAFSGSTVYVGNGGTTGTPAALLLSKPAGGTSVGNNVEINPGNGTNRTVGGSNTSGTNTFTGLIKMDGGFGENRSMTVTAAGGGTIAFTNTISGAGQNVIKTGLGLVVFSGPNTYSGATAVNAGTLRINGSHTGGGGYVVGDGANPATLDGIGSTSSAVNVSNHATLSPGNSIGVLATGSVTFATGANFRVELDTTGGVVSAGDRLDVTGDVTLGSGVANLVFAFAPVSSGPVTTSPSPIVILKNDGVDAVSGYFKDNSPSNVGPNLVANFDNGVLKYALYYNYDADTSTFGGGNDVAVVFTEVPEPGSLWALAAGALACRRRRDPAKV